MTKYEESFLTVVHQLLRQREQSWGATAGPALLIGLWLVGMGQGELMLLPAAPLSVAAALAFLPLRERPRAAEVAFEA